MKHPIGEANSISINIHNYNQLTCK